MTVQLQKATQYH